MWIIHVISVLCLLCFCACLFIDALWSHAGKGPVIILPFSGYSLCILNLGINPNKILRLGKNSPKLGKYRPFWIRKQPVLDCKIGKIKSLRADHLALICDV